MQPVFATASEPLFPTDPAPPSACRRLLASIGKVLQVVAKATMLALAAQAAAGAVPGAYARRQECRALTAPWAEDPELLGLSYATEHRLVITSATDFCNLGEPYALELDLETVVADANPRRAARRDLQRAIEQRIELPPLAGCVEAQRRQLFDAVHSIEVARRGDAAPYTNPWVVVCGALTLSSLAPFVMMFIPGDSIVRCYRWSKLAVLLPIAKLTAARTLDLSNMRLTALPAAIGNLTALRTLVLRDNQLTGLPATLANCTALEELDLSGNGQLSGSLAVLCQLPNLRRLYLERTSL